MYARTRKECSDSMRRSGREWAIMTVHVIPEKYPDTDWEYDLALKADAIEMIPVQYFRTYFDNGNCSSVPLTEIEGMDEFREMLKTIPHELWHWNG